MCVYGPVSISASIAHLSSVRLALPAHSYLYGPNHGIVVIFHSGGPGWLMGRSTSCLTGRRGQLLAKSTLPVTSRHFHPVCISAKYVINYNCINTNISKVFGLNKWWCVLKPIVCMHGAVLGQASSNTPCIVGAGLWGCLGVPKGCPQHPMTDRNPGSTVVRSTRVYGWNVTAALVCVAAASTMGQEQTHQKHHIAHPDP